MMVALALVVLATFTLYRDWIDTGDWATGIDAVDFTLLIVDAFVWLVAIGYLLLVATP